MAPEGTYRVAETAFFKNWGTKKSIVSVAGSDALTIYCGAGATIDRTTLSWGDLVYKLLIREADSAASKARITTAEAQKLREKLSPLELASIYEQYVHESAVRDKSKRTSDAHVPRLQDMLYRNSGWESGVLVRNIVRLAIGLSVLGRDVKIVTTNYDSYIEQEIDSYLEELTILGVADVPGYNVKCVRQVGTLPTRPPSGTASTIELLYLHGRIPPAGGLDGALALSESDYQELRPDVSAALRGAFTGRDILVLGSSLTDPPLLGELANEKGTADRTRVALVPATSTGMADLEAADFPKLVRHLHARARQFGLELLVPDFHFQIGQFCQEVIICAQMGANYKDYGNRRKTGCRERYGDRLVAWWDQWEAKALTASQVFVDLNTCLDTIEASDFWGTGAEEVYKLELWVRDTPISERRLALWGASTGVLEHRAAMKYECLELTTSNASVRAFIEGKPLWLTTDDLDDIELRPEKRKWIKALDGRWSRYLAVPIRLDEHGATNLPVGVVTLAAMGGGSHTNVPVENADAMADLVKLLQETGQALLGVP